MSYFLVFKKRQHLFYKISKYIIYAIIIKNKRISLKTPKVMKVRKNMFTQDNI